MATSPLPRLAPSNIPEQSAQLGQFNTLPASPPPTAAYQPKFYQHPLVSGNIPAMLPSVTSEDYQKRLLLKKPTASILSNPANPAPTNGEAATPTVKSQTAEKNKVKFSDTIQVAVVPVRQLIDKKIFTLLKTYYPLGDSTQGEAHAAQEKWLLQASSTPSDQSQKGAGRQSTALSSQR